MKKIVGITCDIKGKYYESEIAYSEKVIKSGGIPFYLPMNTSKKNVSKIISSIDSLIVTGSRDIDPIFYGERKSKFINPLDKDRTISELLYIEFAKKRKKKVFGICGGMQLLNVAYGGSLHQDISFSTKNPVKHSDGAVHKINVKTESKLYKILRKKTVLVNSFHHQSINSLGKGLLITAKTKDNVIEAIESNNGLVIGVQWHPEISKKKLDLEFFKWLAS